MRKDRSALSLIVREIVQSYALCTMVFVAMNLCWLVLAPRYGHEPSPGPLLRGEEPLWIVAMVYLVYVAVLVAATVVPALYRGSLMLAAVSGLFAGFMAYGAPDFIGQATVIDLRWLLVETGWGSFVTMMACVVSVHIGRSMGGPLTKLAAVVAKRAA